MISLIGCSNGEAEEMDAEPKLLKVLVGWSGDDFFREYASYFTIKNPNIEFEVITLQELKEKQFAPSDSEEEFDYEEELKTFIENENPDVLVLDENDYETLIEDNRLYDLTSFIEESEFDIENLSEHVIQLLKEKGNGNLYGLVADFSTEVLYYNKDLFDVYNVEYPTDQMTWDQILEKSAMFPSAKDEDSTYGFEMQYGDLSILISQIASTYQLSYADPDTMQVTVNTEAWKKVFETAMNAYESNTIFIPSEHKDENEDEDTIQYYYPGDDRFIKGQTAMTIDRFWLLDQLESSWLETEPINFDIVTVPVDANFPDRGGRISLYNIFSINAQSENIDTAWEFVEFVNGNTFAKANGKSTWDLMTRREHMNSSNEVNMDAFYKLASLSNTSSKDYENYPETFLRKLEVVLNEEIDLMSKNEKTVEETLQSIQSRGEEAMQEALSEEASNEEG